MDVQKARKRPVVNDYVEMTEDNGADVAQWCGGEWVEEAGVVLVPTLEGQVRATADGSRYVIRGTLEEFYPIRPPVFAAVYQEPGGPGMRLHPLEDDGALAAVCDCGERCEGDSIRDAVVAWAAHAVRMHREEL